MHITAQAVCLLTVLASTASAAPAPTAETSLSKRWGWGGAQIWHPTLWRASFYDFVRRETDPQTAAKCNMQDAQMPAAPTPLPPPSDGLYLSHVALGRGTQNYTCDTTNATAVPVAMGAVATLFNVSCVAADSPALLERLPVIALNLPTPQPDGGAAAADMSGHHYFTDTTTPFFNLDTATHQYGEGAFKKGSAVPAPASASAGQGNKGYGAVAWLKLVAKNPSAQSMQEVYRLNTAGGNPPKTCSGQQASFTVEYSAEYWMWSK